jgi:hypothetical protein
VHTSSSDENIVNNSDVGPRNEYVHVNNMQCHSGQVNDVSLPTFTDSSKQNPDQFLLDLDLYVFHVSKIPEQFKLPLAMKSGSDVYVVNWLHSVRGTLRNYSKFKQMFIDLLWSTDIQSTINAELYRGRYDAKSDGSFSAYFLRHSMQAAYLSPRFSDVDLTLSAHIFRYMLVVVCSQPM